LAKIVRGRWKYPRSCRTCVTILSLLSHTRFTLCVLSCRTSTDRHVRQDVRTNRRLVGSWRATISFLSFSIVTVMRHTRYGHASHSPTRALCEVFRCVCHPIHVTGSWLIDVSLKV
jgi:hypothetical protein